MNPVLYAMWHAEKHYTHTEVSLAERKKSTLAVTLVSQYKIFMKPSLYLKAF